MRPFGEWDHVTCKSINHLFLDDDGSLVQSLMPDYLHPSEEGYVLWGNAIMEWIEQEKVFLTLFLG